jgi:lipoate-protein ligase A
MYWIWGNNPAFEITKTHRFSGDKIELPYNAFNGNIESIHFAGDIPFDGEISLLEECLCGCPLNYDEKLGRLESFGCEQYFFRITNREIASLILE